MRRDPKPVGVPDAIERSRSKPLEWRGSSHDDVRSFPPRARHLAGWELWRLQLGQNATDARPMPGVGPGVIEIRIHAEAENRVLVVTSFEAIVVLHAFEKKSRKTPRADVDLAKRRFRSWLRERSTR